MASSTATIVQLRVLARAGGEQHARASSRGTNDDYVNPCDTDPVGSSSEIGNRIDAGDLSVDSDRETLTQAEHEGRETTPNETSTNTSSHRNASPETHISEIQTNGNTIKLEWSYAKAATVMAVILALIFGAGSWATQNYANRLSRTSAEIARYELCADHEELRNTPKCQEVMAETLYALGLSDTKTHNHLRRKAPVEVVRIVDERLSAIPRFLVDSTRWMPEQVARYHEIVALIGQSEAKSILQDDLKKKVHRLRTQSDWACARMLAPGGQRMKTKIANGTINEINGLYGEILEMAKAADLNMTMTTTERMQLADLVSGGYTSFYSRPAIDFGGGVVGFG